MTVFVTKTLFSEKNYPSRVFKVAFSKEIVNNHQKQEFITRG
jgi:hypothetical protein